MSVPQVFCFGISYSTPPSLIIAPHASNSISGTEGSFCFSAVQIGGGWKLLVPSGPCLPIILCSPVAPIDLVVQRNLMIPKVVTGHRVTDFTGIETLKFSQLDFDRNIYYCISRCYSERLTVSVDTAGAAVRW